jgi:excisionase family DNA binding protein
MQRHVEADDPLYSVPEAAQYLGNVSVYTIHSWLSKGRLTRTKIGSRTMIKRSELQRFVREENTSSLQEQKQ